MIHETPRMTADSKLVEIAERQILPETSSPLAGEGWGEGDQNGTV